MNALSVRNIEPEQTYDWLLRVHYAKRIPPINHAFGLFRGSELMGVVTYGVPSSSTLRRGVAGDDYANCVIELNRLCFAVSEKNWPSMLVSSSLRQLPKPSIVVSYADTGQGHVGYVYQACNFIYTGLSAKRTDWKVKGLEHLHGQTIADKSRDSKSEVRGSRSEYMRETYGDDFYLEPRSRKHRYIYLCATRNDRAKIMPAIRYGIEPYPKGDSTKYAISAVPHKQDLLF